MSPSPNVTGTSLKALAGVAILFVPGGLFALFAYALFRAFLGARARALAISEGQPIGIPQILAELTLGKIWQQTRSYFQLLIQIVDH